MKNRKVDVSRHEADALGSLEIAADALWGIHTQRALNNFPNTGRRVPQVLIGSIAVVKHAAAVTNAELGLLTREVADAIVTACNRICEGGAEIERQFPLDALQGGAGTSTNMNVNEVVANLALEQLGKKPGDYETVHPLHHVNLHQSTNDVYPTALRIAAIAGVRRLSDILAKLQAPSSRRNPTSRPSPRWPHGIAARRADDARPGVFSLCRSDRAGSLAHVQMRGTAAPGEYRRHRDRHGLTAPRAYIFRVIEVLRASPAWGCRATRM